MDVVLPNGRVVKGIPDGTSKEEIKKKLIANGIATAADFERPMGDLQTAEAIQRESRKQAKETRGGDGFLAGVADFFTGSDRTGRDIEGLPTITQGGLAGQDPAAVAKIAPLMALTNDPMEMSRIIQAQIPSIRVQENIDEKGNVYPVLTTEQGKTFLLNKPGIDKTDLGQFLTQAMTFAPASKAITIPGAMGKEALTETAIQTAQEVGGGEFDVGDVALAGAIGGGGKALEQTVGAGHRAITNQPDEVAADVLRAGEEFDVPIKTTDVAPPQTGTGRAVQMMGENIPFVGTGGERAKQQAARIAATEEFLSRYQGGTTADVIQGLSDSVDKVKAAAGKTYQAINPGLDAKAVEVGGIKYPSAEEAIDKAMLVFGDPRKKINPKAIDLLEEIQGMTTNGIAQDFSSLKHNIGTWEEILQSMDPAVKSQTSSNEKRILTTILRSLRTDRDAFAKANLSENDFRRLKVADQSWGGMSADLKETKLKGLLDKGEMTPEIARDLLFSKKPSDYKRLFVNLSDDGRQNARSVILTDIAERAGNRAGGLTPDALATELSKNKELIETFFRGPRRKEIVGFMRLLEHTRRAQKAGASFTVPTGERTIPWAAAALGGSAYAPDLAAIAGTIGGMARIYESPKVRNILIRMNATKPGSSEFERLAIQLQQATQAAAQATKEQPQEMEELSKSIREGAGGGQI